jgi:acetate kinase
LTDCGKAEDILNTKSGWKCLTGTTDFGVITSKADLASHSSANNVNRLAFDLFTDRILTYVGSYYLKLDGQVDALVFAAGIGERSKELREAIGGKVKCLGFAGVDPEKNAAVDGNNGVVIDVGAPVATGVDSEPTAKRILVCRTDEQVSIVISAGRS